MRPTLLIIVFLFSFIHSHGGQATNSIHRKCGSTENMNRLKQLDPTLEFRMQQLEKFTKDFIVTKNMQNNMNSANSVNAPVTIPVVFHIVYNSPSQNITDAQCLAQIDQLNLDFAKLNSDTSSIPAVWQGIAANTNIRFCLAQQDPNGAATSGIERRATTVTIFTTDDNVKQYATGGMDAWPSANYLNIWVANLGSGLLGYAQFPGGPPASDGVVLLYSTVGSMQQNGSFANYNLGRTATHEVGHWLHLYHIWGDEPGCAGSDNVGDTPNQGEESYGCPAFPLTDGCAALSPGVMFMNYMDYVDDGCMNMFTEGQSTRMNALFSNGGPRESLISSPGCQAPIPTVACGEATGLNASSITPATATLSWNAVAGANSYILKYKKSTSPIWSSVTTGTNSIALSNLSGSCTYQWQVQAICSLGGGVNTRIALFTTLAAPPCGVPSALSSAMITAGGATVSWGAVSGATSYTVQYKTTSAVAWNSVPTLTNSRTLAGLVAGTEYTFQVLATCQSGSAGYSATSSFTTLTNNCTDIYEPNNSYLAPVNIPTNTDITGQIDTKTDADWFRFTTTAPNTKVMIVLSNLPKDYNMILYNASYIQIATAMRLGMGNDTIKRNFTSAGVYYLKIFGRNGVYDASLCYNLRVNVSSVNYRLDEGVESDEMLTVKAELNVFPNPVKDILNVNFTSLSEGEVIIRIFDMVGKVVLNIPMEAVVGDNKYTLDFTSYHNGIYFVEFLQGELKITKKVIRE